MEFGVAKSLRFIPFHQMARSLGPDQSLEFKFFHAFSGCATTSSLSGKARKKFLARGHPRIRLRHCLKKTESVMSKEVSETRGILFSKDDKLIENIRPTKESLRHLSSDQSFNRQSGNSLCVKILMVRMLANWVTKD